ncbi:MAG: UDP-N-acetylmuramoyl-L-alanine--D-glutamate ligase [Myxococcales bacterium]
MSAPFDLRGANALVVGLGRSGRAAVRLLASQGARVTAVDEGRPDVGDLASVAAQLQLGRSGFDVTGRDLIVVSPGVPLAHVDLAGALARGAPVVAEVELASWFLPQPLVGITGTNGKSTTTALCGEMLRAASVRAFVGGNLGTPLCEAVGGGWDALVVELSSFQLEGIRSLRARVGAFLNLTPDHLDRYATLDGYAAAKARLFENQRVDDVAVLNAADPASARMAAAGKGRRWHFGPAARPPPSARPAEGGFAIDFPPARSERYALGNRALRGQHNLENAMAAALCARALDVPAEAVQRALDSFAGLPHRLELVRELRGVEYVNDSKATNVDSAAVALRAVPGPLWWIGGGRGKGAPYAPLRSLLADRTRGILLIGEDAPAMQRELGGVAPIVLAGTLEAALHAAAGQAKAGETVLLSPACASYDQFRDYEERGDTFRRLVREL